MQRSCFIFVQTTKPKNIPIRSATVEEHIMIKWKVYLLVVSIVHLTHHLVENVEREIVARCLCVDGDGLVVEY